MKFQQTKKVFFLTLICLTTPIHHHRKVYITQKIANMSCKEATSENQEQQQQHRQQQEQQERASKKQKRSLSPTKSTTICGSRFIR